MLKVREEKDLDCILAGSYGDSIGRAEYASRRVTNLLDMRDKIKNPNGFLKKSILNVYKDDIDQDINFYLYTETPNLSRCFKNVFIIWLNFNFWATVFMVGKNNQIPKHCI